MITIDCMYIQETCQYVRKHTSTHTQMSQMRQKTGEEMVFLWLNMSGWWFQPLWKLLVSWDDYSQYMEKQKTSKPPTRRQTNIELTIDVLL